MYRQLYFDYNATTPCDEKVLEAMLPFFKEDFGNASSSHHPYGWLAKNAIEEATESIAGSLGVSGDELIYTSGATESINMVIKGVCKAKKASGNHIITTKAEHKAVLDTCKELEKDGIEVTYLDVDRNGLIPIDHYEQAITDKTILIATLYANNETGVIQPLRELGELCGKHQILLFSDTTQALGKIPLAEVFESVDFACFSAHKLYGPKGVGMVYAREATTKEVFTSFIQGGGQQGGLRGGTLNTPGIIGLASATLLAQQLLEQDTGRMKSLRDRLEKGISSIELSTVNGKEAERLPNTSNISFQFVDGENLLRALSPYLAVSNGSACNSASVEPSHVLTAMGVARDMAYASLRFSLGRFTTEEHVDEAVDIVSREIAKQRENNILWVRR
ncbi:cysteine desulfurase family protein [Poritiphilus flavus]|uniref:cysteine desulfurase n=1 Tax=Poritiphilus flavus TaxID=2697053 RepID=A0A6L9EEY5_9FLAO|nr:cysteine desulfurase family protein [Poritiphilus flavus]NAS13223.1 aminotransferase class V-fold PLP-dependent enzyme [Poritiphilus flavus]